MMTWRVVPAGGGSIAHGRVKYAWVDRRWWIPWALVGRWWVSVGMHWLMRQFKARVEDTAGSSAFGVPLLVSRYALTLWAVAAVFLGILVLRAGERLHSRG